MNTERWLAGAALAAALGTAWAQSGATLTASAREGRLWPAWIESRPEAGRVPDLSLALYDTAARRLTVLHVPMETRLERRRTLERAYLEALRASGDLDAAARAAEDSAEARLRELSPEPIPTVDARLTLRVPAAGPQDEPAIEAARALKSRARAPREWARLLKAAASGLRRGDRGPMDQLLFALELRRVAVERLEPARLPDDALAPALLGRLLSTEPPPDDGRPILVEVLNGAAEPGLAARAAKMMRYRGVDVLTTGGAPARSRTLVYDRVGDFRKAAKALAALGCPSARAATRVDPSRAVDVSVELGADCASAPGAAGSREPQP